MGIFSNPPRKDTSTPQPGARWIEANLHWLPTNVWVAADDSGLLAHHAEVDIVTQRVPAELRQSAAYTLYFVKP